MKRLLQLTFALMILSTVSEAQVGVNTSRCRPSAAPPSSCSGTTGVCYVDTDDLKPYMCLNSAWTEMATGTAASNPFSDATALVKGSADATKLLRFEVDGFTTGTTRLITPPNADTSLPIFGFTITFAGFTAARTINFPDANGTVVTLDAVQTLTNKTLTTPVISSQSSAPGTAWSATATAPAATTGASQVGVAANITASNAVASTDTAGAAAGGDVNITSGNAARLTSGNANGGTVLITPGTGIGTGITGPVRISTSSTSSAVAGFGIGPNTLAGGWTYGGSNATIFYTDPAGFGHAVLFGSGSVGLILGAGYPLSFSSAINPPTSAGRDIICARESAGVLQCSQTVDQASPGGFTLHSADGSGTDQFGSTMNLRGGVGTGNAISGRVHLQGGAVPPTSGTGAQSVVDRFASGIYKVLTDNSVVNIVSATIAAGTGVGGMICYGVEVSDGTDFQQETGCAIYSAVNKGGTVTRSITEVNSQQSVSSGTLTTDWAISAANPAVISLNANTSLTPSANYPRMTYTIQNYAQQAITIH